MEIQYESQLGNARKPVLHIAVCLGEYQNHTTVLTEPQLFVHVILESLQQMSFDNFTFYTGTTAAAARTRKT